FHEAPADADALDMLLGLDDLFPVRGALVELVATAVEANLVGHGHEDRIFIDAAQGFGAFFLFTLAAQEQQAGKDVDVGLGDEGLHRQIDGGEHLRFTHDPPADVFRRRVAENAVGQDDAHAASARLEPLDAALDEKNLRRDAAFELTGVAETAFAIWLPVTGQLVLLQDMFVGNWNIGAEGGIGGDDIHRS